MPILPGTFRRLAIIATIVAGLALAGCGGGKEVGKDIDTSKLVGKGGLSLGETTTTAAPATTAPTATPPPGPATTPAPKAATATTAPKAAPTTAAPAPAFEIAIQSDSAGSQFDPRVARVKAGSMVRWENRDSVPRSVEADDGSFRSPSIPPGGAFEFRAARAGNFNYHDGTRPYAVGSLEVV